MTNSPYVPDVAFDVMPLHAVASSPHTVPKSEAMVSASAAVAAEGTHAEEATMFSHKVVLGVGGRISEASQLLAATAGQARGTLEEV